MAMPKPTDREAAMWILDALKNVAVPFPQSKQAAAIETWLREKARPAAVETSDDGSDSGTGLSPGP